VLFLGGPVVVVGAAFLLFSWRCRRGNLQWLVLDLLAAAELVLVMDLKIIKWKFKFNKKIIIRIYI
jgi:hypothetical protein